jgi:hypothetical protein
MKAHHKLVVALPQLKKIIKIRRNPLLKVITFKVKSFYYRAQSVIINDFSLIISLAVVANHPKIKSFLKA